MAEFEAGTAAGAERPRPLSPHLQIYKPTLTMVMSIVHRITGAALYFGMLLLAWWLIAAASGQTASGCQPSNGPPIAGPTMLPALQDIEPSAK